MTPERKAVIEKARERVAIAYDKLTALLDEDGHGLDCVYRCIEDPDCTTTHFCNKDPDE